MLERRISRLFAQGAGADFNPLDMGFRREAGTQVYKKIIPSGHKTSAEPSLSAEEIAGAGDHIFRFLRELADRESGRELYKSAGALIGKNKGGNIIVLAAVNAVPYALAEQGIGGEDRFEGARRGESENATVHFELHCMLAAGHFGPLTDVVMYNCDFICPNCAKYTAAFNACTNVVDAKYLDRPLASRIIKDGIDHRQTSLQLLASAGVRAYQHGAGSNLIPLDLPAGRAFDPPVIHEFAQYKGPKEDQRMKIIGRLHNDWNEAPSAAALMFNKKGKVRVFYAASEILGSHMTYNGHNPGALDPLSLLLVHASAQGCNLSKAEVYYRGPLDVNCALHTVTARPKFVYLADGEESLAPGAKKIFELAEQRIITPYTLPRPRPDLRLVA